MSRRRRASGPVWAVGLLVLVGLIAADAVAASAWTLVGWNDLGMHCMDGDYSVLSLLPPYNTIYAQLIDPQGRLVRDPGGITVTYEAVADPGGSINSTSLGKTNFWEHVQALFGVSVPLDMGLAGSAMPGAANQPQPMPFDAVGGWFVAQGIPLTPYDDAGRTNPYPLMRLVARDAIGGVLATTDIVLPVSDEMDCRTCHSSGSGLAARPLDGWVFDADPQRDMRLNILRLHDDRERGTDAFQGALTAAGYEANGLFATATSGQPVLCARCHLSAALPGSGMAGVKPLTQAVHGRMAYVLDPTTNLPMNAPENLSACYRCHPGSVTRGLRGIMGVAIAEDGSRAIQCQSCHGSMSVVASPVRTGWLSEPVCQSCHTGTATNNTGEIRYTSVFDASDAPRAAADDTFATNSDTPAPGLSVYRFSKGHGSLTCEACHGSPHAEFPSTQRNDNIQSVDHQGHVGMLVECTTCHAASPETVDGGPHGMHPVGQVWVDRHPDAIEEGRTAACQLCHGADYRGTVLSRSQADRTISTDFGTKHFWRGFQIGCYTCHNGPNSLGANSNRAPLVNDGSISTSATAPVTIALSGRDADGNPLVFRIVSQPDHGTVSLAGVQATYHPAAGFLGVDTFTFAAWDGSTDSNLGSVSVGVEPATCAGDCNGSHQVTIEDLVTMVSIALNQTAITSCEAGDINRDGHIVVNEIIAAVSVALSGCEAAGGSSPRGSRSPREPWLGSLRARARAANVNC